MKKSLLSILLALCMALALLPGTAWADNDDLLPTIVYPVTGGNIYFSPSQQAIYRSDEGITEAVIPSEIEGFPVTSIYSQAFHNCRSLTSVTIPDSVTTIVGSAFMDCSALISVTIPSSVTALEFSVFRRCSSLTSVTIPASVTSIGEGAFYGCKSLTDVYYEGSESQWEQISISIMNGANEPLFNATIHYNSTASGTSHTSGTQAPAVVLSPQKLAVNGENVECEKYNIDGANYFKLRDLAQLLSGTASQFEVGYDQATKTVTITTGAPYTSNGTELAAGVDNSSTAQPSSQTILIDGVERGDLTVYNIGGSNFFKLRDLGDALGFAVGYDEATKTATVTSAR